MYSHIGCRIMINSWMHRLFSSPPLVQHEDRHTRPSRPSTIPPVLPYNSIANDTWHLVLWPTPILSGSSEEDLPVHAALSYAEREFLLLPSLFGLCSYPISKARAPMNSRYLPNIERLVLLSTTKLSPARVTGSPNTHIIKPTILLPFCLPKHFNQALTPR